LGSRGASWPSRCPVGPAFAESGLAAVFATADGAFAAVFAVRATIDLTGVRTAAATLLAALPGFRDVFAPLPAFATFDRSALAGFGLAARRPAGTGFRFGAVFAFRI